MGRNRDIIARNLALSKEFFEKYPELFSFYEPQAGSMVFPELKLGRGGEGTTGHRLSTAANIQDFCDALVEDYGVMVLPGSVFDHQPEERFRVGLGRVNFPECLNKVRTRTLTCP
mmetsp:Transcript_30341/g.96824  ORF Transcript_30341/g.96824 Transcript_30341/m.96824 type:complete len:115 (-) Transcript_30341:72-416(-)